MPASTHPDPPAAARSAALNPKETLMKFLSLVAAACVALSGTALASDNHDLTPKHGGLVVVANDLDFELVAKANLITLHVRDHGKVVGTKGATGKLTLLAGSEKSEASLAPAGDDRLEAKGSFKVAAGTRVVATVQLPGKKPANVRFVLK
jgi:hypothetical protein